MVVNSVHWFRKGLRLHDNPALQRALEGANTVRCVYFLDPWFAAGTTDVGINKWRFLLESLQDLDTSLRKLNSRLFVVRGQPANIFPSLLKEWNVTRLTFEYDSEPFGKERDAAIVKMAQELGVEVAVKNSHTLYSLDRIIELNKNSPPLTYKRFQAIISRLELPKKPVGTVTGEQMERCRTGITENHDEHYGVPSLEELGFKTASLGPAKWKGGETEALRRMDKHLERKAWVASFERPKIDVNSLIGSQTGLSPYLRFGCLSCREFYYRLLELYKKVKKSNSPPLSLYGQLLWREFFYTAATNNPKFDRMQGNPICVQIPWDRNPEALAKWAEGCTGYPWIDAIMTQLRQEGWIHHLARHAVACFLTRGDLWISWESGMRVFEEMLLDADFSVNAGSWMWLSCSAFFQQFFHCYCPVGFGKRTDPSGDYIRRYIPKLKKYPKKYIHEPWNAPESVQKAARCIVGVDYPKPMIKHAEASRLNIERMKQIYQQLSHYKGLNVSVYLPPAPPTLVQAWCGTVGHLHWGSETGPLNRTAKRNAQDPKFCVDAQQTGQTCRSYRLTHDISLEEFEDEDLSEITEITDECGMSLNCNDSLDIMSHVSQETNSVAGKAGASESSKLQTEMLQLDLIDAVGDIEDEEAELPIKEPSVKEPAPVTMDTYRPKRPTTLNLFPQVPRTQDTLNNNSFGKKYSWQEKVSRSSSPLKTGELTPTHDHICLSDEDKVQHSTTQTKDRGTSTDAPCCHTSSTQGSGGTRSKLHDKPTATGGLQQQQQQQHSKGQPEGHRDRIRYHTDVQLEATEEIYLTPVQKNSDSLEHDKPFLSQSSENRMSISSDIDTTHYQSLPNRTNPSINEEDEVYTTTSALDKMSLARNTDHGGSAFQAASGLPRTSVSSEASGLSYDSVKYTLVVDENMQLELVSLKQCYSRYSDDSDSATVYDNCVSSPYESAIGEDYEEDALKRDSACVSQDSTPETDLPFSRKFLNVFMHGRSSSSSAESFGLFSCVINGEEREQTHRAVFRFVPRHVDELELEVDDPLLVEVQADDYWYEAYNMRTGLRGVFPAYYAIEVTKEPERFKETEKNSEWVDKFRVKFLGSVQVPYHKGNDVLCLAMQKIATNRRATVQFNPTSSCILEINMKGIKIVVQPDDYSEYQRGNQCSHFFQLKNISFCGYHPKNHKYFGFITKHPADHRFACHVFVSEDSTKPIAESVGRAFQQFYKEYVEYTCPTEDIYLE
ncbi:UNVERIFIED_CONTAM: hypothetical protein FKN15_017807 [Acipenser sinensis]